MKSKMYLWLGGALLIAATLLVSGVPEWMAHALAGCALLKGGLALANVPAVLPLDEMKSLLQQIQSSNQKLTADFAETQKQLQQLRRSGLGNSNPARLAHQAVSDDCARYLAAVVICGADSIGGLNHIKGAQRDSLVGECKSVLGVETRSALTSSDIPLPTQYSAQVVELIWKFGQARQFATVYPLGTGTVKLPQLKTSPTFGFLNQSASIPEKSPQIQFVTFTAQKAGGIVRVPSEIDTDTIVPLGQFLARYIAREAARWEDTVLFLADGTSTYNSLKGVGQTCVDGSLVVTLGSGKTKVTDITIADLRSMRAKVNGAALFQSAYYFHPSMEALLRSFNSSTYTPFVVGPDRSATFEGFPVRWVGVLPVYDTTAHASQIQGAFGDLSYWYLGERSALSMEISREVFFATDELAVRALERFTV